MERSLVPDMEVGLAGHEPHSMDELTYGIAYPTAIMIVHGKIGIPEVSPEILADREVRRISLATELVETEHYNKVSVRQRWADVTLFLSDRRELRSQPRKPKGDPDDPLSDAEIAEKYHRFATPVIGAERAASIEAAVSGLDAEPATMDWLGDLVYRPTP
jgi:2-methylcitrate dehydratase PrpD